MVTQTTTNTRMIADFETALTLYETLLVPNSENPQDYLTPATTLAHALVQLQNASVADKYSMMRILITHVQNQTGYTQSTVAMMTAQTPDFDAMRLFMTILTGTMMCVESNGFNIDLIWPNILDRDPVITDVWQNYPQSDQAAVYAATQAGHTVTNSPLQTIVSDDQLVTISVNDPAYTVLLDNREQQVLDITKGDNIPLLTDTPIGYAYVLVTPVIPSVGLSTVLKLSPTVVAQLKAFQCIADYEPNSVSVITLPNLWYRCALTCVTLDSGQTWTIVDIAILPPLMPV